MVTREQLLVIMPYARTRVDLFIDFLNNSMEEFSINTPERQAAFLAQVGHESGQLKYVRELASGAAYEFRKDLGNNNKGDGVRYKGRGLIQITGKTNYAEVLLSLNINCLEHPELLETIPNACRTAAWWWKHHGLNELADKCEFLKITKIINGGTNGLGERLKLFEVAKRVLKVSNK